MKTRLLSRYLPFAALIAISGCQSTPIEQLSYTETKALGAQMHKKCVAQGVTPGTGEFDACMRQEIGREASIRQERADMRKSGVVCNNVFGTVICN